MTKYIDGEKLAQRLEGSPLFDNFGEDGTFIKEFILELIKMQPAADVAREIFEEIEEIAMHGTTPFGLCLMSMGEAAFAELKKKYTEEGK